MDPRTDDMRYARVGMVAVVATAAVWAATCTANDTATVIVEPAGTPQVLIGAGDIGACGLPHSQRVAALIDTIPGTVFTLGDNAYPNATATDYANCYAPTWGSFKNRTHPTSG